MAGRAGHDGAVNGRSDPGCLALARAHIDALDAALPQTQCRRCGYDDCRAYAQALAGGAAAINRCPPGGNEGIARLAALTGRAPQPLDPSCGSEGPRRLAVIDESGCIGCTLCIQACPVDCIVGASKQMHTVIDAQCTGCELCVPVCPVDCIQMVGTGDARSGWDAWSRTEADAARQRYAFRRSRLEQERSEHEARLAAIVQHDALPAQVGPGPQSADPPLQHRRAAVAAAIARAKAARAP